jgi:hypothetical protein
MKNHSFSAEPVQFRQFATVRTAAEWFARLRRTGSRLVMLMIVMFTPGTVLANTPDASAFNTKYSTAGTRIDATTNCQVCHTSIPALNGYGSAYKANGRNSGAFEAIKSLDSDSDGFTNLVEIEARTFPGNAADKPFTVGGNVSGLTGSVTLQNNGGNNLVRNANGGFTFTTALASGSAYAVTVASQPAGQTCTVANGSGDARHPPPVWEAVRSANGIWSRRFPCGRRAVRLRRENGRRRSDCDGGAVFPGTRDEAVR